MFSSVEERVQQLEQRLKRLERRLEAADVNLEWVSPAKVAKLSGGVWSAYKVRETINKDLNGEYSPLIENVHYKIVNSRYYINYFEWERIDWIRESQL